VRFWFIKLFCLNLCLINFCCCCCNYWCDFFGNGLYIIIFFVNIFWDDLIAILFCLIICMIFLCDELYNFFCNQLSVFLWWIGGVFFVMICVWWIVYVDETLLKLLIQRQRLVVRSEPSITKLSLLVVLVLGANNSLDIVVSLWSILRNNSQSLVILIFIR